MARIADALPSLIIAMSMTNSSTNSVDDPDRCKSLESANGIESLCVASRRQAKPKPKIDQRSQGVARSFVDVL